MVSQPRQVSLRHGDATISVIVQGDGPAIVLLPSLGRGSEDYVPVARAIASAGFQVLRPQPRGIGGSIGATRDITLHDLAGDVAETVRRLGSGRAVLVGHAFGNWVARAAAADHPRLVRGVCIAAGAAKIAPPHLAAEIDLASDEAAPTEARLQALRRAFFATGNDPEPWLHGWSPAVAQAQRAAARAVPRSEWWSAGEAPILDLQSSEDPFRPESTRNELMDELGERVTVRLIDGASHALLVEKPAEAAAAIVNWAAGLPR